MSLFEGCDCYYELILLTIVTLILWFLNIYWLRTTRWPFPSKRPAQDTKQTTLMGDDSLPLDPSSYPVFSYNFVSPPRLGWIFIKCITGYGNKHHWTELNRTSLWNISFHSFFRDYALVGGLSLFQKCSHGGFNSTTPCRPAAMTIQTIYVASSCARAWFFLLVPLPLN